MFGFDPKEHEHRSDAWQHLIHPDDLEVTLENFNRHCEDPSHPYDQVVRYKHKSGSMVWVRCRGIAIRDESGKPIRMLGAHTELTAVMKAEQALKSAHDELERRVERRTEELIAANRQLREEIAERKRFEAELKRTTEQYRLITDAMPALIAYVDPQKRYQFTNRAYEDWFGLPPEKTRGREVRDVLGEETYEALSTHIDGVRSGRPRTAETQIRDKDGNRRVVETRYVPDLDREGTVVG